jgi:centromere protein I
LEEAVLDGSCETHQTLVSLYAGVLRHWTVLLLSYDTVPEHANASVTGLVAHVNKLAMALMQAYPSVATESVILDFYEQNCRLVVDDRLIRHIRIELPSALVVYTLFFGNSLASAARLCDMLARYKRGFELAMSSKARQDGSFNFGALSYNRAYVGVYNGFLMDICNCFWRSRAFADADPNAQGCMIPRATISTLTSYVPSVEKAFSLASLFSLSHSPAICLYSIKSLRSLEDATANKDESIEVRHAGPVTHASLSKLATSGGINLSWQEYRIRVLEALNAQGFVGIAELLKSTMTVLKTSMDGRSGSETRPSQ